MLPGSNITSLGTVPGMDILNLHFEQIHLVLLHIPHSNRLVLDNGVVLAYVEGLEDHLTLLLTS